MTPTISYTIWFSQRTGSTLLSRALEATGIAGHPAEWLSEAALAAYPIRADGRALQEHLWQLGSTPNGVFGIKHSFYEPQMTDLLALLRQFPGPPPANPSRAALWERAFPNHRHIFMTRRNKVRLAVSWWKAIQTEEWHRAVGAEAGAKPENLSDAYHFDAINHLYMESVMREAGMQEFFSEGGIAPLTVVYEDFILEYEETVRRVLAYLGIEAAGVTIAPPSFERLADAVSEAWAQRFRAERQGDWDHRGW